MDGPGEAWEPRVAMMSLGRSSQRVNYKIMNAVVDSKRDQKKRYLKNQCNTQEEQWLMKLRMIFFVCLVIVVPSIICGNETQMAKPVTTTSGDSEIAVECLGMKARTSTTKSVRVYVHYKITNNSSEEKFGILDFKAHCPFQNELTDLEGGFVVTNLGPNENAESENLWYFPRGCWDKVKKVELCWKKLPLDHPLNPKQK